PLDLPRPEAGALIRCGDVDLGRREIVGRGPVLESGSGLRCRLGGAVAPVGRAVPVLAPVSSEGSSSAPPGSSEQAAAVPATPAIPSPASAVRRRARGPALIG